MIIFLLLIKFYQRFYLSQLNIKLKKNNIKFKQNQLRQNLLHLIPLKLIVLHIMNYHQQ